MILLCLFILGVFCAGAYFLYRYSKKQKSITKAVALAFVSFIILSVGLELSVFNINFYNTAGNVPIDLSPFLAQYENDDGTFTLDCDQTVEFPALDQKLYNIHIDLDETNSSFVPVTVSLTDDANKYYYATPERTLYTHVEKSQYINLNTSGESFIFALSFDSDSRVKLNGVTANCERPFDFSLPRVALVVALLCFIYFFIPSSVLYGKKLKNSDELKSSMIAAIMCVECGIIIVLGSVNPLFMGISSEAYNSYKWDGKGIDFVELDMEHHNQYDQLAQAILQGKAYIDNDDVPDSLKNMDNPYDTMARHQESLASGDEYRWDVAYFNGHYYVYFGIVPLLIMYLPFRSIADAPFPSAVGIMIFALVFSIGVFKLIDLICRKHFKNISLGTYLLTSLTFINCCGMTFLVKRPDFYSVPIITGMAFVVWGLYMWLKGKDSEKRKLLYFFLGSLFSALAVGCRPQSALMCFTAVPLFIPYFFKDKHICNKKGIGELIILGTPFIVVASGLMYYNYIRFGSPIDFGSAYNLTTNDVTSRGFNMGRTGLGLFTYLFQTPNFTATFPYIRAVEIETAYIGKTIYERCFGGLITSLPILWTIFALPKTRKVLKEKKLYGLTCLLLLIGISTVIADTQAGGLLQRYYSDFGYIFFLAALIIIFALYETKDFENNANLLNITTTFLCFLSIFYTITLAFSVSDATINIQNPTLFGRIQHLVEFWL